MDRTWGFRWGYSATVLGCRRQTCHSFQRQFWGVEGKRVFREKARARGLHRRPKSILDKAETEVV